MSTNEIIGFFIVITPVLVSLGGLVGAALVQNWKPARDVAVGGADYIEAVKNAVEFAERYGIANVIPGAEKFSIAVKEMDKWLDAQGIHGDAKRITLERVKADIELMRADRFPKRPA